MATQSVAGTVVSIASGNPATYDSTGFAAQTWKAIGKLKNLGEFGKQFDLITNQYLSQRGVEKRKGTWNAGQLSLEVNFDSDQGQDLCQTALDSDADFSFKVMLQSGTIFYLRGLVTSFRMKGGGPNDMFAATIQVELNPIINAAGAEFAAIKV